MSVPNKFLLALILLFGFSLSVQAKKSRFTIFPGYWHIDQALDAFSSKTRCTLFFDLVSRQSGIDQEFFDTFADELLAKGKKANAILSCGDSFLTPSTIKIGPSGPKAFYQYKPNSPKDFFNPDISFSNSRPAINVKIDSQSNNKITGSIQDGDGEGNLVTNNFTATRRHFIPGSRVFLKNSIRPAEKLKSISPGDTVTFVAQVKSLGPTTLGHAQGELYISLNDEISVSDITVLQSDEDGSENISICFGTIDSSIPAQIQCTLKELDAGNDRSKLIFKVTIPESLEGKDLQIAVFSVVDDEVLKVLSRPASFEMKVKTKSVKDSRAKVSCVIKGSSPIGKITGFVDSEGNEGSAFFSKFDLNEKFDSNNKTFTMSVNAKAGPKNNAMFSFGGQFTGNPSLDSLATGETINFQINRTRLSVIKSPNSFKGKNVNTELNVGGGEGTGPFSGALKMTETGDKTVSGLITVKMSNASLVKKVDGLEKSSKIIPETTVTCKFRGLRTQ